MAFSNDRMYILQRDDPMHTLIPRVDDCSEVEIMFVAPPRRGEEGMGAAAVGPGHRATTYTGVRGPELPRVDAERATATADSNCSRCTTRCIQSPLHQMCLMGVKSTNSQDRVELPPTLPRSRRRDRKSYSPYH